jgi:hypothetical protein
MDCYISFWRSSLYTCISTKSFIELGSRLRTVACEIKIVSVKYIYKKYLTICFACEKNKMESSVCMVTESWTCRCRFFASDCDSRVKFTDITCWMYSAHTVNLRDIWWSKIPLNRHVIPGWKLAFYWIFFLSFVQKITQLICYQ